MDIRPDKYFEKEPTGMPLDLEVCEIKEPIDKIDREIDRFFEVYGRDFLLEGEN